MVSSRLRHWRGLQSWMWLPVNAQTADQAGVIPSFRMQSYGLVPKNTYDVHPWAWGTADLDWLPGEGEGGHIATTPRKLHCMARWQPE